MNKQLEKICNSGDFEKIFKIMESKSTKPSLIYKDMNLTNIDLVYLKEYIIQNILRISNQDARIPDSLVQTSMILGEEHTKQVRETLCNFVSTRKSADISHFVQNNFHGCRSLRTIFELLETTVEAVSALYDNLPSEWNIELGLVTRSLVMIKQTLCDHFFQQDLDTDAYCAGLIDTVNFEKKLRAFFEAKKCCIDTHLPECVHVRMLSRIFVPNIEVFFENLLIRCLPNQVDRNAAEKGILRDYVKFFVKLESVYSFATYFHDSSVFNTLAQITDYCLISLHNHTKIEDVNANIVTIVSTMIFVQQTADEFFCDLNSRHKANYEPKCIEMLRSTEKILVLKLEKIFDEKFSGAISDFVDIFDKILDSSSTPSDNVRGYILEICMGQLFFKITTMRICDRSASKLLEDLRGLEVKLMGRVDHIPYIRILRDYLQIFSVSVDKCSKFIENFHKCSNGRFEFNQVLRMLEDQGAAQRLYETFKALPSDVGKH